MKIQSLLTIIIAFPLLINVSIAAPEDFSRGPVFDEYGENVLIEGGLHNPSAQRFKVVFDIANANETDKPHRNLNSVARFINMHVRAGVPIENIDVAIVVHGKASFDLMSPAAYADKFDKAHPSAGLLNALLTNNVEVYLCGQSSSYYGIAKQDLQPGVSMSLSAMTANALLQQQGYTLNPF